MSLLVSSSAHRQSSTQSLNMFEQMPWHTAAPPNLKFQINNYFTHPGERIAGTGDVPER